jgi:hypothetical protein
MNQGAAQSGTPASPRYRDCIRELMAALPRGLYDPAAQRRRPRPPTQAFSDFLINREQGDWAEDVLKHAINEQIPEVVAYRYGRADDTVAGETGFEKFFNLYYDELEDIGKRPDLILFRSAERPRPCGDLHALAAREIQGTVRRGVAGLEVRSSSFVALPRLDAAQGRRPLSYTPKVEDLHVIFQWIENHGVPHHFVQVFFDSAWILPFERVLRIIGDPENERTRFSIERDQRNQFKTTIHIPIIEGTCITKSVERPAHSSASRELSSGRVLFYVRFSGGKLSLDRTALLRVLGLA